MIFQRISHRLALQFTGFVFLLFLVNGVIFLAVDFGNIQHQGHMRMQREGDLVLQHFPLSPVRTIPLPPRLRDRVRLVDGSGNMLYSGAGVTEVPFPAPEGFSMARIEDEDYEVLTVPVLVHGFKKGTMQIMEPQQARLGDLPLRAALYFLVSMLISALTYLVGLLFSRRSLRPAEQMMERLEQFTQDASHELRTPLAVLNSSLDVALRSKNYKEGIESAKEDVREITRLIERLLELAQLDRFALRKDRIDLSALTQETVEKFRVLAREKSITLTVHAAPNIVATADALLIRQVLSNLLTNAIKFTPAGGTIDVTITKKKLGIRDTGIGMRPEDLPHLFDRFFQADDSRSHGGFGLGLALVKRILDLHEWMIDVQSTEGKGTTFTISF